MGATIADRTVNSVLDRTLELDNAFHPRAHAYGTNWNVLRVFMRYTLAGDPGPAGVVVQPRFFMGLVRDTSLAPDSTDSGQSSLGLSHKADNTTREINAGGVSNNGSTNRWTLKNEAGSIIEGNFQSTPIEHVYIETVDAFWVYGMQFDFSAASGASTLHRLTPVVGDSSYTPSQFKGITLAQLMEASVGSSMSNVRSAINSYHVANGGTGGITDDQSLTPSSFSTQGARDLVKSNICVGYKGTGPLIIADWIVVKVS